MLRRSRGQGTDNSHNAYSHPSLSSHSSCHPKALGHSVVAKTAPNHKWIKKDNDNWGMLQVLIIWWAYLYTKTQKTSRTLLTKQINEAQFDARFSSYK